MHFLQGEPKEIVFRHQALLYATDHEFVAAATSFIRDAVLAGEPILVMVGAAKIDMLRSALSSDACPVLFADIAQVGRNPARILSVWRDFVAAHAGQSWRLRGISEPIWPGRRPAEVMECQRHEALLNVAFANAPTFWLLCLYDSGGLDPAVIGQAYRTHPFVGHSGQWERARSHGNGTAAALGEDPLPEPPCQPLELVFHSGALGALRRLVSQQAVGAGLGAARAADLVLAVHEVAANSLRHGGGWGILRVWLEDDVMICEVRDTGQIGHPLAGWERPATGQDSGRGLWIVNQVCDLVQLRSSSTGTVVRLHMALG